MRRKNITRSVDDSKHSDHHLVSRRYGLMRQDWPWIHLLLTRMPGRQLIQIWHLLNDGNALRVHIPELRAIRHFWSLQQQWRDAISRNTNSLSSVPQHDDLPSDRNTWPLLGCMMCDCSHVSSLSLSCRPRHWSKSFEAYQHSKK
jgi:hypothetical protein